MGAMLWFHDMPWRDDPADALRAFQAELFTSRHDFQREFEQWRQDAEYVLKEERATGDRYGLVEIYEAQLARIQQAIARGLPTEPIAQMTLLRQIIPSPSGFSSILDVTGVNDKGGVNETRPLKPAEVVRLVGTQRPTLEQANAAVYDVALTLGRSDSVCFAIFSPQGEPYGWFFVGNTHD